MARWFAAAVTVANLLFAGAHACASEAIANRVVSANLCADQLLMALADSAQIVSLSPLARQSEISYFHKQAKLFQANRGHAEDVVRQQADLVLVSAFDSHYMRAMLAAQNLPFMVIAPWRTLDEGKQQIRQLAYRLGHPERGEKLIGSIDRALEQARATDSNRHTSLILERRGYVPGTGSLMAQIATQMGLLDISAQSSASKGGFMGLENLVTLRPEYLIVADLHGSVEDQGQAFLIHPALLNLYPAQKRIKIPSHLSICGGPSTPEMIDRLAAEIRSTVKD